jgi:hypothetical protein
MTRNRSICSLIAILAAVTVVKGQPLFNGDANFPIVCELQWGSTMNEVLSLCERQHIAVTPKDSAIVIAIPVLGFSSHTELQFDQHLKALKSVQAKFVAPTKQLADSITSYLTRTIGRGPVRTSKEKNLIITTIRMEMALWRLSTGMVNLVTAMRGDSFFDASLVLFPPIVQQTAGSPK